MKELVVKILGRIVSALIWLTLAVAIGWGAWALVTLDVMRPLWIFLAVGLLAILALALMLTAGLIAFFAVAWCFGYGLDDDGNFGKLDRERPGSLL